MKLPHVYSPPPGKADAHWAFWSDTALDPNMKRPMIALSLEMEVFLFFSFLSFWVFFFFTHTLIPFKGNAVYMPW